MTATPSTPPMFGYQVIDLSSDGGMALLQDTSGQLHVVRLRGAAGVREETLVGRPPKPGLHLLLAGSRGTPICVDFEAVACTQDQALDLLHPVAPRAVWPTGPDSGPGASSRGRTAGSAVVA